MSNLAVFYRGPSQLDGAPILGIVSGLTTPSRNSKTGDMLQTYILREDLSPPDAVASGADASICGRCAMRGDGAFGRACYVKVSWAPLGIWKKARTLPTRLTAELATGRVVRMGTYGDPAAIPFAFWHVLARDAHSWTGYTHQWRTCDPRFRTLLMASVDTVGDLHDARHAGWRTFRTRLAADPISAVEVSCPASAEEGHRTTCAACRLCRGTSSAGKSVTIVAHGNYAKFFEAPRLAPPDGSQWITLHTRPRTPKETR